MFFIHMYMYIYILCVNYTHDLLLISPAPNATPHPIHPHEPHSLCLRLHIKVGFGGVVWDIVGGVG